MDIIRILFLADTHLGFDHPFQPRTNKKRRGPDFFKNYHRALAAASEGVDAVIHGGDLFYRSRIPARLVDMAFQPLKSIADMNIPIFIVPGNHECSHIPCGILGLHPNIHIFRRPSTFILERNGLCLGLTGFPYHRKRVRWEFPELLNRTSWKSKAAEVDAFLLCLHHCFEGARVGLHNYTFRDGQDVIRTKDIPRKFLAVLTGHIHRFQVLEHGLEGNRLDVPILYPGSTERTSLAEREETKGFMILSIYRTQAGNRPLLEWTFHELPTKPMEFPPYYKHRHYSFSE
jgi:DNA repair protein SbcD/Mre11